MFSNMALSHLGCHVAEMMLTMNDRTANMTPLAMAGSADSELARSEVWQQGSSQTS